MSVVAVPSPYCDPAAGLQLQALPGKRKALFLDRDGVINVNHGYVHTADATDWVPGIFELVRQAHLQDYLPVVVTNQAGIGRGYYSEDDFLAYTAWIHGCFAARGTPLLATYWCPHHPQAGTGNYNVACHCRKPAPGMLLAAIERFDIDPARSLLLGDSATDVAAAQAAGVRGHLLTQDQWGEAMPALLKEIGPGVASQGAGSD